MNNTTVAVEQRVYTLSSKNHSTLNVKNGNESKDIEKINVDSLIMFVNGKSSEKTLREVFLKITSIGDDFVKGYSLIESIKDQCEITFKENNDLEYSVEVKEPQFLQLSDIIISEVIEKEFTSIIEKTILKKEKKNSIKKESEEGGDGNNVGRPHNPTLPPVPAITAIECIEYNTQREEYLKSGFREFINQENPNERALYNSQNNECIYICIIQPDEFETIDVIKNDFNYFELNDKRRFSLGRGNKIIFE